MLNLSKNDYLALSLHINLWISYHLALITHDTTYVVNSSIQLKTTDITTRLQVINPINSIVYSLEPHAEVYCLKLNIFISKLGYSTCYHPPPPPLGTPPGICHFFLIGQSIPHPRAHRKRQFPLPGTLHWSHTALTHKRETTQLFVFKIKITIFNSVQNHPTNIPENSNETHSR